MFQSFQLQKMVSGIAVALLLFPMSACNGTAIPAPGQKPSITSSVTGVYTNRVATHVENDLLGSGNSSLPNARAPEHLYALIQFGTYSKKSYVAAFDVNPANGKLKLVNRVRTFAYPTFGNIIAATKSGRFLYVTGSNDSAPQRVNGYSINVATGALKQAGSVGLAGSSSDSRMAIAPSGEYLFISTDSGYSPFIDSIFAYRINPTSGRLTSVAGSPYQGGRDITSLAFDPSGKFLFATRALSGDVSVYEANAASGTLALVANSRVNGRPVWAAADPIGRFLYILSLQPTKYGQQYSAWVIAETIDATGGALTPVQHPPFGASRSTYDGTQVAVDPTGKFVFASCSNGVYAYTIDASNGTLKAVHGSPFGTGPKYGQGGEGQMTVDPSGKFVYVSDGNGGVFAYAVNATSGALTPVVGSPFGNSGGYVLAMTVTR